MQLHQIFIGLGLVLVVFGILLYLKVPLFKLPGDISYHKDGFSFYFPLTTSLLISLILSILAAIFLKK